jgi:hypothetical protein
MEKQTRTAYLLTGNKQSKRTLFSKYILETIGFGVKMILYIPNNNKVLSNKISMLYIYEIISNTLPEDNSFAYIFEDDINIIEPITLDEIIMYEKHSKMFFYLGMCEYLYNSHLNIKTDIVINNKAVFQKKKFVRGLHAIGISKIGAKSLIEFSKDYPHFEFMDMILEQFTGLYPANIVRYDLSSYTPGHKGIIFQDRNRFPSSI